MPRRLLPLVKVRLFTKPPYVSGLAKAAGTSAGMPRPIKIRTISGAASAILL